jgi:hypothetical protein
MAEAQTANSAPAAPAAGSVSVDEAVKLMDGLVDDPVPDPDPGPDPARDADLAPASRDLEPGHAPESDPEPVDPGADPAADPEPEPETADAAPEFWSAEDKAAWAKVPAELRPTLAKYEQQRVQFVNEKAREAAVVRQQAQEEVKKYADTVTQAAAWWRQAGPALQQAFADKWSQVNWTELAEKNPGEWARLNQMRQDEAAILAESNRRGQADMQAARQRAEQAFQEAKRTEHVKLAAKVPDYFGTPEKAAKTYDELGKFLFAKGIPVDRINQIHEAPIIEMALNAMRFEQAQKKASPVLRSSEGTVTSPGTGNTTARATPTRVAPGPARRTGNQASEAARQVSERFRRDGGQSIEDAAELIRLNGL